MQKDWHLLTALELGKCIADNTVNPMELTAHFLERIRVQDKGNLIYVRTTEDRAYKEAAASNARAKAGERRSQLDGVPISWKDLYDTAGVPTEGGTPLLSGRIPNKDALALKRATNAGLVCLGKTNTVQFALGGLGTNPYTGTPPNAVMQDIPRAPGGSSCGAAISVASGLAAAGIGSDTGGSVRVPAAWNSLVGFKTSFGVLPVDGVLPLAQSLDTVGPITRSVADAAALFAIMGARDQVDLGGLSKLKRLRFLVPSNVVWEEIDPEVEAISRRAINTIVDLGASVLEAPIPEFDNIASVVLARGGIAVAEAYITWQKFIDSKSESIDPNVLLRFLQGREMTAPDLETVRTAVRSLTPALYHRLAGFDAVLMPTVPTVPPPLSDIENNAAGYQKANGLALRNTTLGNLLPCCAITLPLPGRIPCGLTIMAPARHDNRLLRVAAAVEKALHIHGEPNQNKHS